MRNGLSAPSSNPGEGINSTIIPKEQMPNGIIPLGKVISVMPKTNSLDEDFALGSPILFPTTITVILLVRDCLGDREFRKVLNT